MATVLLAAAVVLGGCGPDPAPEEQPGAPEPPRVRIDTAMGSITVEVDLARAPVTARNFLSYVQRGHYVEGSFYRVVTAGNQPDDPVRIAVIQAGANPARDSDALPPIPLERTRDTGLRHEDGTISMARLGPDTATHSFFICIGEQPELDFGGERNPDGQGFAAFGRVVEGMDVVRAIHASPAEGQQLTPAIPIRRAVRVR